MAVNSAKIRLGAPDLMILDSATSAPTDLGASSGGAVLAYNATYFPVEIDQTIMAAIAYKTKEEITFSVTLVQSQISTLVAAMSLPTTNATTVASGTMGTGPTCTVTPTGGAAGSYSYMVIPFNYNGDKFAPAITSITTGPTTLSAAAYNTIAWTTVPAGATGVKIVRLAGGAATGLLVTIYNVTPSSFPDTGVTATAYTPQNGYASLGTTTFSATTAVDSVATFATGQFVGSYVIAGASISSVVTASSGTTLTFASWTGGTPTSATPFYVSMPAAPATPNMATVSFGGNLAVVTHTFDWAVPKNDGTQNHWLGHLYNCYSGKAVSIDYMRTKQTDLSKLELEALANTALPVGFQAGYLTEMY